MRRLLFTLIDRLRRRLPRDGRAIRVLEPTLRMLTVERGIARPTWTFVRHRGLRVSAGPFAGLAYPRSLAIHVPALAARLAGSYESELHDAVERLAASDPQLVVNVGAGDGLYAVGMALRCPGAGVIAYELDPYPARVCRGVAEHNGVASRVRLRGACTVEGLAGVEAPGRTVLISDCEGAEDELVDPERVPWLRDASLLIEVHEAFSPGLTARLHDRLANSHELETIPAARRYLEDHPMFWEVPGLSLVQQERLMSELRPWRTLWLLASPSGKR
jgi:hypothetical protein